MSSDSDDDVPLAKRRAVGNGTSGAAPSAKPAAKPANKPRAKAPAKRQASDNDDDDDGDSSGSGSDGDGASSSSSGDESDGSDVPLSQRKKARASSKGPARPASGTKKRSRRGEDSGNGSGGRSSSRAKSKKDGEGKIMWTTLRHQGVLFPPEYEPHGIKMLYDGKPIDLTPEQEEVASMFAVMKETDYMSKPIFLKNFWDGFKEVLGPKHVIQSLDKCDFTPMYDYFNAQREAKKNMTKEVRCMQRLHGPPSRVAWAHGG